MRAITIPEFGGAAVQRPTDLPVPEPDPGQISIDVSYAGANFAEILYRQSVADVPLPLRTRHRGLRAHPRGWPEADDLRPGQPVAALTLVDSGGYAEVVTTSADLVAPLGRALQTPLWLSRGRRGRSEGCRVGGAPG